MKNRPITKPYYCILLPVFCCERVVSESAGLFLTVGLNRIQNDNRVTAKESLNWNTIMLKMDAVDLVKSCIYFDLITGIQRWWQNRQPGRHMYNPMALFGVCIRKI